MVDWDEVERQRDRGVGWSTIAADPKVGFAAQASAAGRGRALRAQFEKRQRSSKRGAPRNGAPGTFTPPTEVSRFGRYALLGFLAVAVWFVADLLIPSPVGAYVPAIPFLAFATALVGVAAAVGLLRSPIKWSRATRNGAVVGLAAGVVISGAFGFGGWLAGCPTLHPFPSSAPGGWQRIANPPWTSGGHPVLYFFGSAACPYCSASSWALAKALGRFGSLSGTYFDRSSTSDVDPATPEVVLAHASLASPYIALDVLESTDNQTISAPSAGTCTEQAYVSAYDGTGSIPFVVVGGQYLHLGTFVDPSTLAGLSAHTVASEVQNGTGPAGAAVGPSADYLTAYLLRIDGGQPAALLSNGAVAADYAAIG